MTQRRDAFDITELNGVRLKNRFFRSATWVAECDMDGFITQPVIDTYTELARGGVGAIIAGITSVSSTEIPLLGMAMLCDDRYIEGHRRLTEAVHDSGAAIISQLAISSYCRVNDGYKSELDVDELTTDEVHHVVDLFIDAAERAKRSGYDGVQIHVAHFFFLSRFVSPACNRRTDEYGGSPEGRVKIIREIVEGIRQRLGRDYLIMAKINGTDAVRGGMDKNDLVHLCRTLEDSGADAIEVSGNNTSRRGIRPGEGEGYFLPYASIVKDSCDLPVICVGGFRSMEAIDNALGHVDYISLSRPLIREPDIINVWNADADKHSKCVSCNACYTTPGHKCMFRRRDYVLG